MAEHTGIEWCDATFNPWWGCERVSPACAHCYAETQTRRFSGDAFWGAGHDFKFQSDAYWSRPLTWARTLPTKLGRRPRVFCASMADVFEDGGEEVELARRRLFDLIGDTPELDWLLLTKRPEFARDWLREWWDKYGDVGWAARVGIDFNMHANVWMGVSIENSRFTWRADVLREIPAAVRFISAEPLLGSLYDGRSDENAVHLPVLQGGGRGRGDVVSQPGDDRGDAVRARARTASDSLANEPKVPRGNAHLQRRAPLDLSGIDWVIAGGESGPRARPSHPDWFRELRDATACSFCRQVGERCYGASPRCSCTAFLFKQWGEWAPALHGPATLGTKDTVIERVGKRNAGRELDGRTWDEFPASAAVPA